MLATLFVNVDADAAPVTNDGDLRLREAIAYVNGTATPGALDLSQIDSSIDPLGQNDAIVFTSNLNGGTINLNPNFGSLVITKPVNIFGPTNKVTIRPQFTPTNEMYGLLPLMKCTG